MCVVGDDARTESRLKEHSIMKTRILSEDALRHAGRASLQSSLQCLRSFACTRVLFVAPDGTVITGRSMDWAEDMRSNLWVFPKGMARDGARGAAVTKVGLEVRQLDRVWLRRRHRRRHERHGARLRERLYLAESDYGAPDGKPPL